MKQKIVLITSVILPLNKNESSISNK
jgi:hypothetical protein